MSINVAKWTFVLSLRASRIISFFTLYVLQFVFLQLPCRYFLELLPFLVHCCLCIRYFHRLWHRNKLVNQIVMGHRSKYFTCNVVFVFFFGREGSTRCLVDSWNSTLQP